MGPTFFRKSIARKIEQNRVSNVHEPCTSHSELSNEIKETEKPQYYTGELLSGSGAIT